MKLKLVSALVKFHPLEEGEFEKTIMKLFSAENGTIYQPILTDIVEIYLRRYRSASVCERILLSLLEKFENFTFFLPFFKIINWYKLHGELDAIENLIIKLEKCRLSADNPIIEYAKLMLGLKSHSCSFYPQYYYLLNCGFKEKAWELIKTSFPTFQSRSSYLNVLFECGKFNEYLTEAMRDLGKVDFGKICFALIMINRTDELNNFCA